MNDIDIFERAKVRVLLLIRQNVYLRLQHALINIPYGYIYEGKQEVSSDKKVGKVSTLRCFGKVLADGCGDDT